MVKLDEFNGGSQVHYFNDVYALVTLDRLGVKHLYVAGANGTVIDLSDPDQEEYTEFETVEELADAGNETVLKIYEGFEDFCIGLLES